MNWAGLLGSHQCPGRLTGPSGSWLLQLSKEGVEGQTEPDLPTVSAAPGVGLTNEKVSFDLRVFRTSQGKDYHSALSPSCGDRYFITSVIVTSRSHRVSCW